jgi:predicted amidohydrolase
VKEIQAECERNSIWCIISDEFKIKDKEYNLSVLIDRKGKIAGTYKKINLYYEEVVPGKRVKVFDTDFARIGIVICWDMAFPELFKKLKQKGAQIIFCPALWWYEPGAHTEKHIERERSLLKSLLLARAFENLVYVGVCNPIIESRYQVSYTAIAAPHYIMGEINNREGLLTESINLRDLERFKELYQKR